MYIVTCIFDAQTRINKGNISVRELLKSLVFVCKYNKIGLRLATVLVRSNNQSGKQLTRQWAQAFVLYNALILNEQM